MQASDSTITGGRDSRSMLEWAFAQVSQALVLAVYALGFGLLASIFRRQFHYRAFLTAVVVFIGGLWGVAHLSIDTQGMTSHVNSLGLWGGSLVVAAIGGFFAGRVGGRVAVWESYLAVIVVTALVWVELSIGLSGFLGLSERSDVEFGMFGTLTPGIRILGSMWDRLVLMDACGAWVAAIFGGSFAVLLGAAGNIFDLRFEVEWMLSRRHLSGRKGMLSVTAVVAIAGIALGVAALIAVTSVMSGYQQDIQDKILSTNAHLVVQKYGIDFVEYEKVIENGLTVSGVEKAAPFTFTEAMVSTGAKGLGVLVKGVDPARSGKVTEIESNLCQSVDSESKCLRYAEGVVPEGALVDLLTETDGLAQVVVGVELFRKLDQPIGSIISVTTPVGISGARGNAPRRMHFRLGGVFESGMYEFDSRLLFVALEDGQELMGFGKAVSGVEFRVSDPTSVEKISGQVLATVGNYPYRSTDWRQLNSGIFTALKLQKIVMFLVLTFIVIVAAFNIASTLFMAVVERSHEIGVLKSMGLRDASIMKIFVMEGWIVGLLGTGLGVVLGLLICFILGNLDLGIAADVYMVGAMRVQVNATEVLVVVLASLVISHLATIFPALKAANKHPVDAIRYD